MTEQTVAKLLSTPAGRRALSVESPVFFDTYYCGMRFAPHRERWLGLFERTSREARATKTKGRLLLLAPRDHGKTEVMVTTAARALCIDRNTRILWICESSGQAEKRLRRVKSILESERVQQDWCSAPEIGFGPWRQSEEDKWTSTQVYVARPIASVDPSLESVGSGGAVTGGHFNLILCDDLEDDRTTYSQTQRQKTREWFRGTIGPMLLKGGTIMVIGTRKHHDDLYGHLLEDPTYEVVEDKAISKWPDSHSFEYKEDERGRKRLVGIQLEGESEVLWPAERPIKYLLKERLSVGGGLFAREFQNEVLDDSSAAIRWEWLERAKAAGAQMSLYQIPDAPGLEIVQGWDLALASDAVAAERRDYDYTVGTTWAKDANGMRYLLGISRHRGLTPAQLRGVVVAEYNKFPAGSIKTVVVEKNNFGELYFLGLQRTTDLPLRPHITTGAKKADPWQGIPALATLFELGKVVFPSATPTDQEKISPLVQELWGLGRERHDDCAMSLWIAETLLRKAGFVHRISFAEDGEYAARTVDHVDGGSGEEPVERIREARESLEEGLNRQAWKGLPGFD